VKFYRGAFWALVITAAGALAVWLAIAAANPPPPPPTFDGCHNTLFTPAPSPGCLAAWREARARFLGGTEVGPR
jgi:hypothetical protein